MTKWLTTFFCFLTLGAVDPATSSDSSSSVQKLVNQRQRWLSDLNLIGDGLERSRLSKNRMNVELFLHQLDRIVWPKIIDLSSAIFDHLTGDDEQLNRESKYQEELRKELASIRFRAKARRCKSPDETFYSPLKRCLPYRGRWPANPCPIHQQLYDGPDNLGICDCQTLQNSNGSVFLYSERTKQCHQLFTQGPCKRGHWWIVKNRIPQCQSTPKGCPADGQHVYWRPAVPDAQSKKWTQSKCWKLNSRGPCGEDQLLKLELDGSHNLTVDCRSAPLLTLPSIAVAPRRVRPSSPLRRPTTWCPRGSYRDRISKCDGSF